MIMGAVHEFGRKWAPIAERLRLPGRDANSIKNRFNAKHFQTAFKAFEAQCDATASAAAASSSASSSAAEAPPPPDF
jgi:hypothetical protein